MISVNQLGNGLIDLDVEYAKGTAGVEIRDMLIKDNVQQIPRCVSDNIQRLNYLIEQVNPLKIEMFDSKTERSEFMVQAYEHIKQVPAKFEQFLSPFKEQIALKASKLEPPVEVSSFVIDRYENPSFIITDVDAFYFSHVHRAKMNGQPVSDADAERTLAFLKTQAAFSANQTPISYIDDMFARNLAPNIKDAAPLVNLFKGEVTKQAHDALAIAMVKKSPTPPGGKLDFEDTFRFCAIKAFEETYRSQMGVKIECVSDQNNITGDGLYFYGQSGALFYDEVNDVHHVVQFMMPDAFMGKDIFMPRDISKEQMDLELTWNLKHYQDQGIDVTSAGMYLFGMDGLDDYMNEIKHDQGGNEIKQYLLTRIQAQAHVGKVRLHKAHEINEVSDQRFSDLRSAAQTYLGYVSKDQLPEVTSPLSDSEKQALESEAELLLRQYAINKAIMGSAVELNGPISSGIHEYGADMRGKYSHTYTKTSYMRVDQAIARLADMDILVTEDDIGMNVKSVTRAINKTKLLEQIKELGVDPKQFNNISESLRINTTKEYKENMKPEIERIGQVLVDQVQDLHTHLVKKPVEPSVEQKAENYHLSTNLGMKLG